MNPEGVHGQPLRAPQLNIYRCESVSVAVLKVAVIEDTMAKWHKTKTCRMVTMLCLTFSFFLAEIVFGYVTNSLALIGDSYHMLSDVIALIVGFASLRVH